MQDQYRNDASVTGSEFHFSWSQSENAMYQRQGLQYQEAIALAQQQQQPQVSSNPDTLLPLVDESTTRAATTAATATALLNEGGEGATCNGSSGDQKRGEAEGEPSLLDDFSLEKAEAELRGGGGALPPTTQSMTGDASSGNMSRTGSAVPPPPPSTSESPRGGEEMTDEIAAQLCAHITMDNVEKILSTPHCQGEPAVPLDALFHRAKYSHTYSCTPVDRLFAVKALAKAQSHDLTALFLILTGIFAYYSTTYTNHWSSPYSMVLCAIAIICGSVNFVAIQSAKGEIVDTHRSSTSRKDAEGKVVVAGSREGITLILRPFTELGSGQQHQEEQQQQQQQQQSSQTPPDSSRTKEVKKDTPKTHHGRTLERDYHFVRVYEALAVALILVVSATALLIYPRAAHECVEKWTQEQEALSSLSVPSGSGSNGSSNIPQTTTTDDVLSLENYCPQAIGSDALHAQVIPLLFVDIRLALGAPPLVVAPALYFAGRFLMVQFEEVRVDDRENFLSKQIVLVLLTAGFIAALYHQSNHRLQRFEMWVLLQRSTALVKKQREHVDQTLCNLIPPALIAKMECGLAPFDASDRCTLGITQIFDYVHWSATIMPYQIVELVDALFVTFDQHVTTRFRLVKVKTVGDHYFCCSGLMEGDEPPELQQQRQKMSNSDRRADATRRVLLFLVWAHAFCDHLCSTLGRERFKLKSGIHVGPCCGGIIGVRSMWCDIVGEAFDVAQLLASRAPEGTVTLSGASVEAITGDSVDHAPKYPALDEQLNPVFVGDAQGMPIPGYFQFGYLDRTALFPNTTAASAANNLTTTTTTLKEEEPPNYVEQYVFAGLWGNPSAVPRPPYLCGGSKQLLHQEESQLPRNSGAINDNSQGGEEEDDDAPRQETSLSTKIALVLERENRDLQSRRHDMLRRRIQASHQDWNVTAKVKMSMAEASGNSSMGTSQSISYTSGYKKIIKRSDGTQPVSWSQEFDFFGFDEAVKIEEDLQISLGSSASFCQRYFVLTFANTKLESQFLKFLRKTQADLVTLCLLLLTNALLLLNRNEGEKLLWTHRIVFLLLAVWIAFKLRVAYMKREKRKRDVSQEEARKEEGVEEESGSDEDPHSSSPSTLVHTADLLINCMWYLLPIPVLGLAGPSLMSGSLLYLQLCLTILASYQFLHVYGHVRCILIILLTLETIVSSILVAGGTDGLDLSEMVSVLTFGVYAAYNAFATERKWRQWFHDTALSSAYHEAAENELQLVKGMLNLLIPENLIPFALAKSGNRGNGLVSSLGEVCVVLIRLENTASIAARAPPRRGCLIDDMQNRVFHGGAVLQAMEEVEGLYGAVEVCLEKVNRTYGTSMNSGCEDNHRKRMNRTHLTPLLEKVSTVGDQILIAGPIREQPTIPLSQSTNVAAAIMVVVNSASMLTKGSGGRSHEYTTISVGKKKEAEGIKKGRQSIASDGSEKSSDEGGDGLANGDMETLQAEWLDTPSIRASLVRDSILRGGVALVDLLTLLQEALSSMPRGRSVFSAALHVEPAFASFLGMMQPSFTLLGPSVRTVEAVLNAAPPKLTCMTGAFKRLLCNGKIEFPRHQCDFSLSSEASYRWALRGVGLLEVFALSKRAPMVVLPQGKKTTVIIEEEEEVRASANEETYEEVVAEEVDFSRCEEQMENMFEQV